MHRRTCVSLLILFGLFTSCVSIYVPATPTPALLEKRNSVMSSISFTRGTYHVNAAYAPINHGFVLAEFSSSPAVNNGMYYRYAGLGIGTWKTFRKKYHLELQAGLGRGKTSYDDVLDHKENHLWKASGPFDKSYQQISFTKFATPELKHGFVLRVNQLNINYHQANFSKMNLINVPLKFFIVEPSYYAKYAFADYINFFGSAGITISNAEKRQNFNYNLINFRLGIEFKLD